MNVGGHGNKINLGHLCHLHTQICTSDHRTVTVHSAFLKNPQEAEDSSTELKCYMRSFYTKLPNSPHNPERYN